MLAAFEALLLSTSSVQVAASAAGEGLVDGWLEASDVLHWQVLPISRLQVLVQDGKDLIVEDLELADSVHHLLQRLKGNETKPPSLINERGSLLTYTSSTGGRFTA